MDLSMIDSFVRRLGKIGINVRLVRNVPYVYLIAVNGNEVEECYYSKHNYNAFWIPVAVDRKVACTNITQLFKIIRKYK